MPVLSDLSPRSFKGEILILHCEVVKASSDMLFFGDIKAASTIYMYNL